MEKSKLTMRSKITVYWTTNPADMGYDGTPSYGEKGEWKNRDGKTMGINRAANFTSELSKTIGQGTYRAICYKNAGREVSRSEIQDVIIGAEYDKAQRA